MSESSILNGLLDQSQKVRSIAKAKAKVMNLLIANYTEGIMYAHKDILNTSVPMKLVEIGYDIPNLGGLFDILAHKKKGKLVLDQKGIDLYLKNLKKHSDKYKEILSAFAKEIQDNGLTLADCIVWTERLAPQKIVNLIDDIETSKSLVKDASNIFEHLIKYCNESIDKFIEGCKDHAYSVEAKIPNLSSYYLPTEFEYYTQPEATKEEKGDVRTKVKSTDDNEKFSDELYPELQSLSLHS